MTHPTSMQEAAALYPAQTGEVVREMQRKTGSLESDTWNWVYLYGMQLSAFACLPGVVAFVVLVATCGSRTVRRTLPDVPASLLAVCPS